MKILIGCEFTGTVRSAFDYFGLEAVSCDILPSERPGSHFICDLREKLQDYWDLIIAFPPCTYISSAGLFYCNVETYGVNAWERIKKRNEAVDFFFEIYFANASHICVENPLGFISSSILKPTQIVHPFYFGDSKMKRTALWLRNLPPLLSSSDDNLFSSKTYSDSRNEWVTSFSQKDRSRFSPFIAAAMAEQWGSFLINSKSPVSL